MKTKKLITTGLVLFIFVIALIGLLGLNQSTIEASEGNIASKVNSQTEASVSKKQETIRVEFRIKPEFEKTSD